MRIRESIKRKTDNIKETFNNVMSSAITYVADVMPQKYLADKIKSEVDRRVKETIQSEEEDHSWHRLTDQARSRDLSPLKQDKMIKVVDWLYERNPIAKKILGLMTDITIKADENKDDKKTQEATQKVIDEWWILNGWELKQFDKIEELSKYGEMIHYAMINKFDANVKLSGLPPESIYKVMVDKEFPEELDKIKFYARSTQEGKVKDIIRPRPKVLKDDKSEKEVAYGKELQGEVFFATVNRGTFGTRGKSDILPFADWLDIYDRTLYTMTERVVFLLSFIWDITVNGATKEELVKRRNELELNPIKPGSSLFHNEDEEWEAKSPDLKGADFNEFSKSIAGMLSGGSGLPVHWLFGQGEDVNKASAQEMSEPTLRKMQRRQKLVNAIFRQMVDFSIQQKINKGMLEGEVKDFPYTVTIPEPSKKEAGIIAESFAKMAPALVIATQNEFLSNETAVKVMTSFINQIGIDVKFEDELKKAKENPDLQTEIVQEAFKKYYNEVYKKKDGKK